MKSVLWKAFPFKTRHWSFLRYLLFLRQQFSPPTPTHTQTHAIQAPARMDRKTQRSPLSIATGSNSRGRPDPFTFVSLNGFNSSWREDEGVGVGGWGCKMNERGEQRSSFCPSKQQKTATCQQQRSSPHFMRKKRWTKGGGGRRVGWAPGLWKEGWRVFVRGLSFWISKNISVKIRSNHTKKQTKQQHISGPFADRWQKRGWG